MKTMHHELKTETKYYQAVESGLKTFELRKNDRGFKVGDLVTLVETVNGHATGRRIFAKQIKYILPGGEFGLNEEYCILQL